jgi:excisionase family DNA binding protein
MSSTKTYWDVVSWVVTESQVLEKTETEVEAGLAQRGTDSTVSSRFGAPVVRNSRPLSQLLPVRVVAEVLGVCRATVYAMVSRGELERVWVGASIRIPIESVTALVERGRS